MTDKEFLECFISERMQMHCTNSRRTPSASELEELKKREERHNRMMETLSADAQDAIKKYYESFIDKMADDNTFYYRKGVKDGLLLWKILKKL